MCDFVVDANSISVDLIRNLNQFDNFTGTGFNEPLFCVKDIIINKNEIEIMGKDRNSLGFFINDGIKVVIFKLPNNDELLNWVTHDSDDNVVKIEIVGKAVLNYYNNVVTPQIIITDYNLLDKYKSNEITDYEDEDVW